MTKIDQHLLAHTKLDVLLSAFTYLLGMAFVVTGIRVGEVWTLTSFTALGGLLMFGASAALLEAGRAANRANI